MDENKEINAETESVETTEVAETSVREESVPQQPVRRKNGRNSGKARTSASAAQQNSSASCGEIEDMSSFSEKISGSNVNGYGDANPYESSDERHSESFEGRRSFDRKDRRRRDDRGERSERRREKVENAETSEISDEVSSETETDEARKGPMFEVSNSAPGVAIETPLVDRRAKGKNSFKDKDSGVVSYSPELPKKGVLARIKSMLASVFGGNKKSDKNKKSFNKNKNWKNEKGGKKYNNRQGNRYNNRGRNGSGNGGGKKRYHSNNPNPRRRDGGASRGGESQ